MPEPRTPTEFFNSPHPAPASSSLAELVSQLDAAELALRRAADLCPGDPAMAAGLIARADWCHAQLNTARTRLNHRLVRREGDNPRRSIP